MYENPLAVHLNLLADTVKVHAHVESWKSDKDPRGDDIPWQEKYRGR